MIGPGGARTRVAKDIFSEAHMPIVTGTIVSTRRRAWLVVGAAALVVVSLCAYGRHETSETESAIQNGPLTITVNQDGLFSKGYSWELQVGPSGNATLNIESSPTATTRWFVVSQAKLDELRAALLRERFWDLAGAYGRLVADGHTTTLQVSAGGFTKKVELLFLDAYEGEKARESSRPLRVLMIIRGWFNDPGAVDLRKYDQMVIDAAR